jgi:iron complex outermembrane receptor protein
MRGTFGDWNYDTAAVVNHTWLETTLTGFIDFPQLIGDITNGTYNFIDPSKNSAQVRNALSPTLRKMSTSDMDSIDLRINRPLMDLQGGALGLALGAEVRHEAQDDPDINPTFIYQNLPPSRTLGSRSISAIYGEIDAPILTSLEVDASARYDHYSNFGGAFDPKIGFKWTPIESAALRGTFSRGFRTPSFAESGSSAVEGFTTYTIDDPNFTAAHHNDGYIAPYALGQSVIANPDLHPERSSSATFGGILQPTGWLNASLDYYAIKKTGVILQSDPNAALSDYFAGKALPPGYVIITDAPDPLYPDAPRRPLAVQAPYINANSLRTDGVDLDLRATFPIGDAHFISTLTATKIFSWSMHFPDGTTQQYAGTKGPYILSSGAGTPRYRANWANTLTVGDWETTATIYYTSGMYLSAPDITSGCFSINFTTGNNFPSNCRTPSFTYVDLTGAYHFNSHLEIFGGIDNLFDRKPPFDPLDYAGLNYNPTYAQAGIVGRFFNLGVHVKF